MFISLFFVSTCVDTKPYLKCRIATRRGRRLDAPIPPADRRTISGFLSRIRITQFSAHKKHTPESSIIGGVLGCYRVTVISRTNPRQEPCIRVCSASPIPQWVGPHGVCQDPTVRQQAETYNQILVESFWDSKTLFSKRVLAAGGTFPPFPRSP